jgi:hypothetical protein
VTLVPSKLRLVCLAAFILQKCKVVLWPRPCLVHGGNVFCLCQAAVAGNWGTKGKKKFSNLTLEFMDADMCICPFSLRFWDSGKESESNDSCSVQLESYFNCPPRDWY